MIGGAAARNEQYQGLILPPVTLGYPVGSDVNLVSFARFEFLQLERIFFRAHVEPVFDTGRQSLTFISKLRIARSPRLRLKGQFPLALPQKCMGDIWVRLKKALKLLRMVDVWELCLSRLGHLKSSLGYALLSNSEDLLVVPLDDSFNCLFALNRPQAVRTADDEGRRRQRNSQHKHQHPSPLR